MSGCNTEICHGSILIFYFRGSTFRAPPGGQVNTIAESGQVNIMAEGGLINTMTKGGPDR